MDPVVFAEPRQLAFGVTPRGPFQIFHRFFLRDHAVEKRLQFFIADGLRGSGRPGQAVLVFRLFQQAPRHHVVNPTVDAVVQ